MNIENKRIIKNDFIKTMVESRNCLLYARFEKDVDWDKLWNKCCDFDERFDITNIEFINKSTLDWRKVEEVASNHIKFSDGSRVDLSGKFYLLLSGDFDVDYVAVRKEDESTIVYAVEKLGK